MRKGLPLSLFLSSWGLSCALFAKETKQHIAGEETVRLSRLEKQTQEQLKLAEYVFCPASDNAHGKELLTALYKTKEADFADTIKKFKAEKLQLISELQKKAEEKHKELLRLKSEIESKELSYIADSFKGSFRWPADTLSFKEAPAKPYPNDLLKFLENYGANGKNTPLKVARRGDRSFFEFDLDIQKTFAASTQKAELIKEFREKRMQLSEHLLEINKLQVLLAELSPKSTYKNGYLQLNSLQLYLNNESELSFLVENTFEENKEKSGLELCTHYETKKGQSPTFITLTREECENGAALANLLLQAEINKTNDSNAVSVDKDKLKKLIEKHHKYNLDNLSSQGAPEIVKMATQQHNESLKLIQSRNNPSLNDINFAASPNNPALLITYAIKESALGYEVYPILREKSNSYDDGPSRFVTAPMFLSQEPLYIIDKKIVNPEAFKVQKNLSQANTKGHSEEYLYGEYPPFHYLFYSIKITDCSQLPSAGNMSNENLTQYPSSGEANYQQSSPGYYQQGLLLQMPTLGFGW